MNVCEVIGIKYFVEYLFWSLCSEMIVSKCCFVLYYVVEGCLIIDLDFVFY